MFSQNNKDNQHQKEKSEKDQKIGEVAGATVGLLAGAKVCGPLCAVGGALLGGLGGKQLENQLSK